MGVKSIPADFGGRDFSYAGNIPGIRKNSSLSACADKIRLPADRVCPAIPDENRIGIPGASIRIKSRPGKSRLRPVSAWRNPPVGKAPRGSFFVPETVMAVHSWNTKHAVPPLHGLRAVLGMPSMNAWSSMNGVICVHALHPWKRVHRCHCLPRELRERRMLRMPAWHGKHTTHTMPAGHRGHLRHALQEDHSTNQRYDG